MDELDILKTTLRFKKEEKKKCVHLAQKQWTVVFPYQGLNDITVHHHLSKSENQQSIWSDPIY